MNTIIENKENELIIKKSKFITLLMYVESINDVEGAIKLAKEKYECATHYCYAYIIDNVKRFSDDGEPSGTSGMPILNVLESNNLNHVICIVIRYFGGIKLGAGGLVRAYSKSCSSVIDHNNIKEIKKGMEIELSFKYDVVKDIDFLLKDIDIINKSFDELITYIIRVDNDTYESIYNKLNSIASIVVKKENIFV